MLPKCKVQSGAATPRRTTPISAMKSLRWRRPARVPVSPACAALEVVDACLHGDDGVVVVHHRLVAFDVEERWRLPAGEALRDQLYQADRYLDHPAPRPEEARGEVERGHPGSAE